MQLVNLVSMCLLLKAPFCQRLKLLPCFYPVSRDEAFHTFSHTQALPAAEFSVPSPKSRPSLFPLHQQPPQCVLGDIFGINRHMITDQQVNTTGKNGSRGEVMVWVLAFKLSVKQRVYKKRKQNKKQNSCIASDFSFSCDHMQSSVRKTRKESETFTPMKND